MNKQFCMVVAIFALSPMCFASDATGGTANKWSVYAGIGSTDSHSGAKEATQLHPNGCEVGVLLCKVDDSDTSFQIGAIRRINDYFSVNAQYTNLGNIYDLVSPVSNETLRQDTQMLSATLVGEYPLTDKLHPFVEIGAGYYRSKIKYSGPFAGSFSEKDSGLTKVLGLGVIYQYSSAWGVRAGWQRFYDIGESSGALGIVIGDIETISADVDNAYIALTYSF